MSAGEYLQAAKAANAAKFDPASLREAEQQMRLVLMGTGAMTLDQVDRHAPGLTRAVVGAYLSELRFHPPDVTESMVGAAIDALPDRIALEPSVLSTAELRAAIAAALTVGAR